MPRNGKTALVKGITTKVSKFRKCLIFDYASEWTNHITQFNYLSNTPSRMTNVAAVKNFAFKIWEFNRRGDWISLGFPELGSNIMASMATYENIHGNIPSLFENLLVDLPSSGEGDDKKGMEGKDALAAFNRKYRQYGLWLPSRIPEVSKMSILTRWQSAKWLFYDPDNPRGKKWVPDWQALWKKYDHLIIDLMADYSTGEYKARAYAGKIIQYLIPTFRETKPFIVLEEADKLAPLMSQQSFYFPSSLYYLRLCVQKLQKLGVSTLFISQSERFIDAEIAKMLNLRLIGKVDNRDPYHEYAKWNRWRPDDNYREFTLLLDDRRSHQRFVPEMTVCRS